MHLLRITSVELAEDHRATMTSHAEREFPRECCGVLVGVRDERVVRVERVVPADNITAGDPRSSYQIDWRTLILARRELRGGPSCIVGFYHSHPNGLDSPSKRDAKTAWGDRVYMIVPVANGRAFGPTCWCVPGNGTDFAALDLLPPRSADGERATPGSPQV